MFSEYFDTEKKDILKGVDEKISDESDNVKQENESHDVLESKDSNDKKGSLKIQKLEGHINSKTGEYWSFFNNFPNDFHEQMSGLSMRQKMRELKEDRQGIPEKKIKGFDKTFDDGKSVEVREEVGNITFTFLDEGKSNPTTITLMNFQNAGKTPKEGETIVKPSISIIGDGERVPDFIKKIVTKINGTINLTEDNTEIFKEIFDALDQNIMRPKIEEFHGYVNNIKEKAEDLFLKISTENIDEIDNSNSLRGNNFIDSLIKDYNYDSFTIEDYHDLTSRKMVLALCLLLRDSSKLEIKNRIKKALGYIDDDGVDQKDAINKDENAIEFIPVDEFFVANGDILINLAIEYCKKNETEKSEDVINFLTL